MNTPSSRWQQIKLLFDQLADLPPAQRAARLAASGLDADAHGELLSLLQHHDNNPDSGGFLATPAAAGPVTPGPVAPGPAAAGPGVSRLVPSGMRTSQG